MPIGNEPWYVAVRSEALAGLALTARRDVRILHERQLAGGGSDFLVAITTDDPLSQRQFVVLVHGSVSSDPAEWMRDVKPLFKAAGDFPYLPVCVFVMNIRENTGAFAWAAEPMIVADGVRLQLREEGDFRPLDRAAVDEVIERVKTWYEALGKRLASA